MIRSTSFSCGYDITSAETYNLSPNERKIFSTGLKINMPNNYWGEIKSRSSLAIKGIDVCGGVIDSDYKGEIKVILHNFSNSDFQIMAGHKIAQIIFQKYCTIEESTTLNVIRGESGFGSTGF